MTYLLMNAGTRQQRLDKLDRIMDVLEAVILEEQDIELKEGLGRRIKRQRILLEELKTKNSENVSFPSSFALNVQINQRSDKLQADTRAYKGRTARASATILGELLATWEQTTRHQQLVGATLTNSTGAPALQTNVPAVQPQAQPAEIRPANAAGASSHPPASNDPAVLLNRRPLLPDSNTRKIRRFISSHFDHLLRATKSAVNLARESAESGGNQTEIGNTNNVNNTCETGRSGQLVGSYERADDSGSRGASIQGSENSSTRLTTSSEMHDDSSWWNRALSEEREGLMAAESMFVGALEEPTQADIAYTDIWDTGYEPQDSAASDLGRDRGEGPSAI